MGCEVEDWIHLTQSSAWWQISFITVISVRVKLNAETWNCIFLSEVGRCRFSVPRISSEFDIFHAERNCHAYGVLPGIDFQYGFISKPKHSDKHCRKSLKSKFISVSNEEKGVCCDCRTGVTWLGQDISFMTSPVTAGTRHFTKGMANLKTVLKQKFVNN
jgi:hypothetical protein